MKMKFIIYIVIFSLICFIAFLFLTPLTVTNYTISDSKIPEEYNGLRLLILSDFHGKSFGQNEDTLISKINDCNPDIILLLGDVIDEDHDNGNLVFLLEGISEQYSGKIYAITGNHEFDPAAPLSEMYQIYNQYGIQLLDGKMISFEGAASSIDIRGIKYTRDKSQIEMVGANTDHYSILLYHAPEIFTANSYLHYDLLLSGHTHGGIIRLPFIGGVLANDGSLFPHYDAGLFEENHAKLVVSRGLGDAVIPRFNNPPEIVCITLEHEK